MSRIEIHQTLHGYSDGHRLLAASRRLPREAERSLLIVSDISGPLTAGAFDSYLTGYPVPGTGAYALSRTWLATELNRPGCVWSHTLLVEHADLARIPDLVALRALFRRPQRGEPWQPYGQPTSLPGPPADATPRERPGVSDRDLVRVLAAFYGVPHAPTFLATDQANRLETAVLALWSQQWPRLRQVLRFCTWALAARSIDGEAFDLQVVPPTVYPQLRERQPNGVSVNVGARLADEPRPVPIPGWAAAVARDLLGEAAGELRQFLWRFGADMPVSRAAFAPLADIAVKSAMVREGRLAVADLLESVTGSLPGAREGARLKAALFAGEEPLGPPGREAEVLEALATTRRHAALAPESLALGRRAAALWSAQRDEALDLAGRLAERSPLTPLGEPVLSAVAAAISPLEAAAVRTRSPRLFAILTDRNPALLRPPAPPPSPTVERAPASEAVEPPPTIGGPPASGAGVERPMDAVPVPRGPTTVAEFLDGLNDPTAMEDLRYLPARWRGRLEARTPEVVSWLVRAEAPGLVAIAAAASVVDPRSPEVRRAGASPWLRAIAPLADTPDEPLYAELMAFLLTLALDNPGPGAEELAARAFDPVDQAAGSGTLSAAAWERLASDLPPLPWWREWDRSERLRRGLVERCLRHRWPPDVLLRVTRDDETFQRLVVICEWTRDGLALLKRLAARVGQDAVPATRAQRAMLAPYG